MSETEPLCMPRILHICGDFANQRIYVHLVSQLAAAEVSQVVYAPVRSKAEAAWSAPELAAIPCHMRQILSRRHRVLFRTKIRRIARDLSAVVDLAAIDLVHAHFLYSDGAVALRLRRELGIPFVTAVRNADLNAFMRYRPDLRWIRNDVLREASRVVFLSPAYQAVVLDVLPTALRAEVLAKTLVLPNGIGADWMTFKPAPTTGVHGALQLLYVGDFTRNKNIANVLRAAEIISSTRAVRFTLVGGGGDGANDVHRTLDSGRYPFAQYVGRVDVPDQLRSIYRRHDIFVMPSFTETFGVVYIEALSQGLPVIHSRGQGVDGYFSPGTVSEAVDPEDPVDIARKIEVLSRRLPVVKEACVEQATRFDWPNIARLYEQSYAEVLG